jgi:hypothetical protein
MAGFIHARNEAQAIPSPFQKRNRYYSGPWQKRGFRGFSREFDFKTSWTQIVPD